MPDPWHAPWSPDGGPWAVWPAVTVPQWQPALAERLPRAIGALAGYCAGRIRGMGGADLAVTLAGRPSRNGKADGR
jgi:hypothetical protein